MRLVTYDYIFYGFEKEERICYSRLKELEERNLCRFCVDEPFRESGSLQRFFSKSFTEPNNEETTILFLLLFGFSLAQFECILHVTHFEFFFLLLWRKKSARDEEEKKQKTKPEQRIISEDDWGERENMKERKFHFMNVVYRICADSAFDCFGIEKKEHTNISPLYECVVFL